MGACISQCLMHKSSLRIPVTYSNRYFPSPVSAGQLSLAPDCESGSGSSTGLFWSSARQVLVTQPHGEWRGQEREWKHATVLCSVGAPTLPPACCRPGESGGQTRPKWDKEGSPAHPREALPRPLTRGSGKGGKNGERWPALVTWAV